MSPIEEPTYASVGFSLAALTNLNSSFSALRLGDMIGLAVILALL